MLSELIYAVILIGICMIIHGTSIIFLVVKLEQRRSTIERRGRIAHTAILLLFFGTLILLHIIETCIWASFYYWQGLFGDFETSLYFSLGTFTTIGYGDVLLPQKWRLLGALEGISGVLLCGLSTAVSFTVVNNLFEVRIQQLKKRSADEKVR